MKSFSTPSNIESVRIICFIVYEDTVQTTIKNDCGTLFTLNKTLGADFLQLDHTETTLLINDLYARVGIQFFPQLVTLLHSFTGGHVGMTRAALKTLYQKFKHRIIV
jgi:hypothetical protein